MFDRGTRGRFLRKVVLGHGGGGGDLAGTSPTPPLCLIHCHCRLPRHLEGHCLTDFIYPPGLSAIVRGLSDPSLTPPPPAPEIPPLWTHLRGPYL